MQSLLQNLRYALRTLRENLGLKIIMKRGAALAGVGLGLGMLERIFC